MLKLSENPILSRQQPAPALALARNPILHPSPARSIGQVERELRRLPHLQSDRRQLVRNLRHDVKDARQAKDAAQAIGKLPEADEALHLIIGGRFALWHVVPAIVALSGRRIESLDVATLGFSRQNIAALCNLIDAGQIGATRLLCSHYFKGTSGGIFEHAQAELAKRPTASFASARTHAKLLLLKLEDGRTFTVESSANLRSCKNIEQITVIGNPDLYHFHRQWIDELFTAAGSMEPAPHPAKPPPARQAYSQKRASLGVWAASVSAEDRASAIAWKSGRPDDATTATTGRYAQAVVETIRQWSPVLPPGACVTVPPQGASHPGHYFAADLAQAVAGLLAVPFVDLLARTGEKHYHHPRESMRQKPYRVTGAAPPVVIVVDDLITSGTTMRLSLDALRAAGAAAFGFAFAGC